MSLKRNSESQPMPPKRRMSYNQQPKMIDLEVICLSDDDEEVIKIKSDDVDAHSEHLDSNEIKGPNSENAHGVLVDVPKTENIKVEYIGSHDDDGTPKSDNDDQKPLFNASYKPSSEEDSNDEGGFINETKPIAPIITPDKINEEQNAFFYKRCNDVTDKTEFLQMKIAKYWKEYQCEVLRMRIRRSAEQLAKMTKNSRELMLDSNRLSEQNLLRTVIPELMDPHMRPNPFWE